jgi:hypothetical protein
MLIEMAFLGVKPNGVYARGTDGADSPRPRPAKVRRLGSEYRKQSA